MCVVLSHTKNGVSPAWASAMNRSASGTTSSSIVFIRSLVSGPVSSMRWVPSPFAQEWMTPRGPNLFRKSGKSSSRRVVVELGLLLGVEVVEVAEELVEAVRGRQELVTVAEVVLAELAGGVALRLEGGRDGRVLGPQPDVGPGHPHLGQAGAVGVLPGDERRPPGGAALLAVVVGEPHALVGDPVDVRGPVAHQTVAVAAQVADPDVVTPDDQDVGLVGHVNS